MKKLLFACLFLILSLPSYADTAFQTYYPSAYAWASRPTCSTAIAGMQVRFTDIGTAGSVLTCNGTSWVGRVVWASGATLASTNTTSEERIGGITIPAGLPSANSVITIWTLWDLTSSGNNKTQAIEYGAAADTTGTQVWSVTNTNVEQEQSIVHFWFANNTEAQTVGRRDSTSGSVANNASNPSSLSIPTAAAASYINFLSTKATGTETNSLVGYDVVLDIQ